MFLNFKELSTQLDFQRKALIKIHGDSEDGQLIRSTEQAQIILNLLEYMQNVLMSLKERFPSLLEEFEKDYVPLEDFLTRNDLYEICFIQDVIFLEGDIYRFADQGVIDDSKIQSIKDDFQKWSDEISQKHQDSQVLLREHFKLDLKRTDVSCDCSTCSSFYTARLRDEIQNLVFKLIDDKAQEISSATTDTKYKERIYNELKRDLDRHIFRYRPKLKTSVFNKLEKQVRAHLNKVFNYPSEIAKQYAQELIAIFKEQLFRQGLRRDLVSDHEYDRFFIQLGAKIWKSKTFLEDEFNKFLKSILLLKRKDISAGILIKYLGEFWTHSLARQIKRKIIYHMGPTNSGKTYHAIEALCGVKKGCYLAPLRLLASELFDTMNKKGVLTTLMTGEEIIEVKNATHYSSTVEMARFHESFDCVVIDEIQMMSDTQRGWAWTRALINIISPEIHICGDHTVLELVKQIVELCGDELEIKTYDRMVELQLVEQPIYLSDLEYGDAVIVFSRKNALKYKKDLEQLGFKVSIVYGRLSPEVRREQARKFDEGLTDVIVSTDAIAMGMNLPIKRIIFSTLSKFIDSEEIPISKSEIKQIAGRAGRYLRHPIGYVGCLKREEQSIPKIKEALPYELEQKEKCMVGPDLEIFSHVNRALKQNALPELKLSEFLRLFHTMNFKHPFVCADLTDMIELAEMVEEANKDNTLNDAEIFGFSCAPVNLGMPEHVQYFVWILNKYATGNQIVFEEVDYKSDDIDYLETSIKCVELYQWLSRHFNDKYFEYNLAILMENKALGAEKLNALLSDKIRPTCSSCGKHLELESKFAICEDCFRKRRFRNNRQQSTTPQNVPKESSSNRDHKRGKKNFRRFKKKR